MLFLELHAQVLLEQRRQSDSGLAGELCRDTGVEQVNRMKAVVAVEHAQIIVGVVEGLFELRIRQQRADGRQLRGGNGDGVDKRRLGWARDLEEVDTIVVTMEAGGFRIDADLSFASGGGDERRQLGSRVDVERSAHSSFPSASSPAAISSSALANVL